MDYGICRECARRKNLNILVLGNGIIFEDIIRPICFILLKENIKTTEFRRLQNLREAVYKTKAYSEQREKVLDEFMEETWKRIDHEKTWKTLEGSFKQWCPYYAEQVLAHYENEDGNGKEV